MGEQERAVDELAAPKQVPEQSHACCCPTRINLEVESLIAGDTVRGKAFVWLHNGADAVKDREGNVTGHRMVDGKRFGWVEFSTPKTAWDDVLRAIRDEVDKG